MRTTIGLVVALLALVPAALWAATTGVTSNQTYTAAPAAVAVPTAANAQGSSLALARADHVHAVTGTVAAGSVLTSAGAGAAPAWRAAATCTSSSATTCTIADQRAGCLPVCSMTTTVSTAFSAELSSTTITCTFGTSGTNTCNCICP